MEVYLKRIWKYRFHYLLAFLPVLAILLLKGIPFILGTRTAFADYNPSRGVFGSAWTGWTNFRTLFAWPEFRNALENTLAIKLSYLVIVSVVSLLLAIALCGIRSARLRNAFVVLFLLPYFIPSSVYANTAIYFLSPPTSIWPLGDSSLLTDPASFQVVVYVLETLKTCGIPVFLMVTAILAYRSGALAETTRRASSFYLAFRALAAFLLIQLSTILSIDFELLHRLNNPTVYSVGDTLDTFWFRIGFLNLDFSRATALWLFQFAVQLAFTLIAYLLVRKWFVRDLFAGEAARTAMRHVKVRAGTEFAVSPWKNTLGIVAASLYSAIVLFGLYALFVYPFLAGQGGGQGLSAVLSAQNIVFYLFFYGAATAVGLMLILMLAYPLTVRKLPGRSLYKLLLLFGLTLGTGGTLHDYMMHQSLGTVNTIFPLFVNGMIVIMGVFVLKSIFNANTEASLMLRAEQEERGSMAPFFTLFIPRVWRPLLGLGVLSFAALWNSYLNPLIYLNDPELFPPVYRIVMMSNQGGLEQYPEIMLQFGAVVSLPPILLFLALSRFLTSDVFVGALRRL